MNSIATGPSQRPWELGAPFYPRIPLLPAITRSRRDGIMRIFGMPHGDPERRRGGSRARQTGAAAPERAAGEGTALSDATAPVDPPLCGPPFTVQPNPR